MSVTMRDVARRAGFSVATVSRVLNGSGPVAERTRARVAEAASALHYVPNATARSLKTRLNETVGVLLPDLYGEFYSEVIRGVEGAARARGYHTVLTSIRGDHGELAAALRSFVGRVDGLVVMSPEIGPDVLRANFSAGVPVALLGRVLDGHAAVTIDNEGGAYEMTAHLARLGHRRIAHVAGGASNADTKARLAGYRRALAECGLGADPALVLWGDFTEDSGYAAGQEILGRADRPTAVFAANDAMAIGVLKALREGGLSVPDDVALVGFDDVPVAAYVTPGLTTARAPIREMGARAVEAVLDAVDQDAAGGDGQPVRPAPIILPTRVVVRTSCGGADRSV